MKNLTSAEENNQGQKLANAVENNQEEKLSNVEEDSQEEKFNNVAEYNQQADLINITECSEEFMEEYFEDSKKIKEENNKENILIVTSKEKIENTFGASDIVEAPNNQYLLQYDSEEEKNKALKELKELEDIVNVEENKIRTITGYNSWGIEKTGLDYAIEIANEKELNDVTVAIIDTGCDMELFNQNYPGKIVETYNVLNPGGDMVDEKGHGTHIAGTIAEATPSNVKILPIKVSTDGYMLTTDIIEAINYITYYDKADIINMSFGGYEQSDFEYQAIEAANKENIISIASAGNDNTYEEHYPSAFDNTISIASIDSNFNKSDFSNYGSTITFTAPGTDILSINGTMSGTSMATPHAASAVAILKSYNKNITLDNTIELLKRCAIDLGSYGQDDYYGYGCINFKGTEFYDGSNGDEYKVFKDDGINTLPIIKIECEEIFSPVYNYGNNTNIMNANINFYYSESEYYTRKLCELKDFEIEGYEPYNYTLQTVTILYNNIEILLEVDNSGATKKGWEYKINEDNTITITKFNKEYGTLTPSMIYIPQKIDDYTVTGLGKSLFSGYSNVNFIEIPDTITTIGEKTFYNCKNLKEVKLPNNLIKIGESAFWSCYDLEELNLPDSLIEIGTQAFSSCESLKEISIPKTITVIEWGTFSYCHKLSEVELPRDLIEIEDWAFEECISLKNIQFPDSLENIGNGAFYYCIGLEKIVIPKNVVSIGTYAFDYCNELESIVVDEENAVYDSRDNCNALIETESNRLIRGSCNTTEVPETVKILGRNAFARIGKLTKLVIHEGVEEIEGYSFGHQCYNLKDIIIPKSVKTIDGYVLTSDEKGITVWVHKGSYVEEFVKEMDLNYRSIEVNVPIKKTEYKAFESVNIDDLEIIVDYDDGTQEVIKEGINVKYTGKSNSLRGDDTYFTVSGYNKKGLLIEKRVEVTVTKVKPEYTIPTNIEGVEGQKLSEIKLPEGFEWMDETQVVEGFGNVIYKAKYTPKDTINYEIVENIEIRMNVSNSLQATISKMYNTDNTVTVKVKANITFKDTKTTWTLSKDQKTYTKTYNTNGTYSTMFEDIYGHTEEITFTIDEIVSKYNLNKIYDLNTNMVTVSVVNNFGMQQTKPTWNLSLEQKTYTKVYTENGTYTTTFTDIQGMETPLTFTIQEIDDKEPELSINMNYDSEANTVTAEVTSDEILGETKPTWTLSEDKKTYTKVYNANGTYTTIFQDIYGNENNFTFEVNQIQSKYEIEKIYDVKTNVVTVFVTNNFKMQEIKPTWQLSEEQRVYTKTYTENGTYTTTFTDEQGVATPITFIIEEIQ